jgi:hypothetical protein
MIGRRCHYDPHKQELQPDGEIVITPAPQLAQSFTFRESAYYAAKRGCIIAGFLH